MWPVHLHVLFENLKVTASWKERGPSRPGFTFYLINIPNVYDHGRPWRILLAHNFGTEWLRVFGSCSGCRTIQDRTHHIDRLIWYHSLVERCTRFFLFLLPVVEARPSGLYSLCLENHYPEAKLLESVSHRISVQFALVLSCQCLRLLAGFHLDFSDQNLIFSCFA